jgi:hypothetical protein
LSTKSIQTQADEASISRRGGGSKEEEEEERHRRRRKGERVEGKRIRGG